MKIHLPDVTLCSFDTANVELAQRALERSTEGFDFGDVVLITSSPVDVPFRTEFVKPFANINEVGAFLIHKLTHYIHTPFVLCVEHDGFIVNPASWQPAFLDYDYIGAKWAWYDDGMNVGNSGFSLMSKRLLDIWGSPEIDSSDEIVDAHLCRVLRPRLEAEYGICFAPESIADLFSYENSLPRQPTLGFHGLFNLWRHTGDAEMEQVAQHLADYTLLSPGYAKIIVQYYLMRKFGPLHAFYARLRQKLNANEIFQRVSKMFNEPFARECVAVCENLIKESSLVQAPPNTLPFSTHIKQPNETIDIRARLFPWER